MDMETPHWIVDEDGTRRHPVAKQDEIWRRYLKPCSPAVALRESPLEQVLLKQRGCTVVEADNRFVLASHLCTALVKRRDPDIPWDLVTPDILMNRLIEGTPEAQEALFRGWDPLVLLAFYWPRYVKASEFIRQVCQVRDLQDRPILFVVRSLRDLSTDPDRFDPGFRAWLVDACPHERLTVDSVKKGALQPAIVKAYLAARASFGRPLPAVVHSGPVEPAPAGLSNVQLQPNLDNPGNIKVTKGNQR